MVQVYVYDSTGAKYELDLYKEEPIKITLSAEEITDLPRVNSAFSRQFRVPATQNNSKVFKWWYEVNTVDFDVTQRVQAEIHVDGLFYKSGHIRIQAAYVNGTRDHVDLELVFFGETRDFASQIGEITLNKLDLTQYNHDLTLTNVQNSWLDLTDPSVLVDGVVRYILAVRGYNYDSAGVITYGAEIADTQQYNKSFQKSNNPLPLDQFTPIVQVKAIIDAIFEQTDYTYSADSFFNDDLFKALYTDGLAEASDRIQVITPTCEVRNNNSQQFSSSVEDRVEFTTKINDPSSSFSLLNNEYTVSKTGLHAFTVSVQGFDNTDQGAAGAYTLRLYRNNTVIDTDVASIPAGQSASFSLTTTFGGGFTQGDKVYATIEATGGAEQPGLTQSVFECTNAPDTIAVASLLKYDVKCIEFFKSIVTKFKLIMVPSATNEFEFVIKPWKDYIAEGQRLDWTTKLDNSKDVTLKPIFFDQSQLIDFTDQPDEDIKNKPFQELNNRVYGALQFDSQNDQLKDSKKIETIFAPTPVDKVVGFDAASQFVIPYFSEEDAQLADHGNPQEHPMRPKPRLLFWNGKALQGTDEDWYYTDGATTVHNTTDYPRATPYSQYPTNSTILNLNWFRDTPYPVDSNLGESVYERYWNQYVQELYSPLARVLTGYFNLDSQDLRELSFDDLIFLNNAYYRVLKVYDAPLAEVATVKVDLVKVLETVTVANDGDPTPGGGGIDDVVVLGGGGSPAPADANQVWGTNDNNYGVAPGTWGNPG